MEIKLTGEGRESFKKACLNLPNCKTVRFGVHAGVGFYWTIICSDGE